MRRLKDYLRFAVWQTGLSYIALWAMTLWSLDWGAAVFGSRCQVDSAKVMFYWACDAADPLAILASLANTALTATVWAPVYVAAATVKPEAMAIAVPIVAAHVLGLPAAIFVMMRLMRKFLAALRHVASRRTPEPAAVAVDQAMHQASNDAALDFDAMHARAAPPRPLPRVPRRENFGLRNAAQR